MKRDVGQIEFADLPTLDPLPQRGYPSVGAAYNNPSAPRRRTRPKRAPSATRTRRGRLLRVITLLIATAILAAGATHQYDQLSRPANPAWTRACRAAVDATARLHQLRGVDLDRAMYATWAAIGGLRVQTQPTLASNIARLQRDADDAIQECIMPATTPR